MDLYNDSELNLWYSTDSVGDTHKIKILQKL
jgi:hypothetical protein